VSRTAYISDVHSNSVALRRVLHEIDAREVRDIVCLGDLVGYGGADPAGVIDMIQARCVLSLCGCEDAALLHGNPSFNPVVQAGVARSRKQLDASGASQGQIEFLAKLQPTARREGVLLVHASPRDPLHEYLLPSMLTREPARISQLFDEFDSMGVGGHTHVPGAFVDGVGYVRPEDVDGTLRCHGRKAFVQVGSVGRPLDGTGLPCFAIIEGSLVEWIRVSSPK
jgi:diadenosine tetraphosphatase ApaH/serine/threonine PP2A family protein phosphatase